MSVQLAWRLRALIASGHLRHGERLPSVRELASWAQVNVNTVRAIYRRLEDDGLVATHHGVGTFVADGAAASADLERVVSDALAALRAAGLEERDLIAALHASSAQRAARPELPPSDESPRAGRALRAELRRQIGHLEAELAALAVDGDVEVAAPAARFPPPRIAGVPELTEIRDRLLDEVDRARATAAEREAVRELARTRLEAMRAEAPETPRHSLAALMDWWRAHAARG